MLGHSDSVLNCFVCRCALSMCILYVVMNFVVFISAKFRLHYGDMTDSSCLVKIISKVQPTEIYNLAAQSHVKVYIHILVIHQFQVNCDDVQ